VGIDAFIQIAQGDMIKRFGERSFLKDENQFPDVGDQEQVVTTN
jgi:hypothetical protein